MLRGKYHLWLRVWHRQSKRRVCAPVNNNVSWHVVLPVNEHVKLFEIGRHQCMRIGRSTTIIKIRAVSIARGSITVAQRNRYRSILLTRMAEMAVITTALTSARREERPSEMAAALSSCGIIARGIISAASSLNQRNGSGMSSLSPENRNCFCAITVVFVSAVC